MVPSHGKWLRYVTDSYRQNTARQKRKATNRRAAEIAASLARRNGIDPSKRHVIQMR